MSEKQLKEKIKKLLNQYKIYYFMPAASVYGRRGTADFICCFNGRFLAIETKDTGKKQTPLQKLAEKQVVDCDGAYLLIYPTDLKTLEAYLDWHVIQK